VPPSRLFHPSSPAPMINPPQHSSHRAAAMAFAPRHQPCRAPNGLFRPAPRRNPRNSAPSWHGPSTGEVHPDPGFASTWSKTPSRNRQTPSPRSKPVTMLAHRPDQYPRPPQNYRQMSELVGTSTEKPRAPRRRPLFAIERARRHRHLAPSVQRLGPQPGHARRQARSPQRWRAPWPTTDARLLQDRGGRPVEAGRPRPADCP